jgi:K+-sensing histidine kinase KdpD
MERHQSSKPAPPVMASGSPRSPVSPASRDARGLREEDVAQIVHDLRDPLATIALETYFLDCHLADRGHADLRRAVGRIIRNVELLDRIVQHLLDSCELEIGCFALRRKPTELRTLLEQVIERVVSTVDRGRVILDAPVPITLSVDDLRIERVVANLIGNALKYAPKRSGIVVRLEVGALASQISVTDAGPGLMPSELERIFDKYRRGASANGVEGRGLGLHVCKTIVEAHGGRMGVDSVHGTGSRFYFDLPALPI